jgi:flavorubredoxin
MKILLILSTIINILIFCFCDTKTSESDIIFIGINDKNLKEYEGQFPLSNGMSFNSYLIIDEKIIIINGVEKQYENEWLENIQKNIKGREPDFILIQHMEPDASESLQLLLKNYPKIKIISSFKSFSLMKKYYEEEFKENRIIAKEGDELNLGKHTLHVIETPMVHWPEVIVVYDSFSKILFSCDAFGKFGVIDASEKWEDEARRYYFGIIGKYGKQVQSLLKKISKFEIKNIFPNHGPILTQNIEHYISLYDKWSKYEYEEDGVAIVYSTVHGHTKVAVDKLEEKLKSLGVKYIIHNLSFSHVSNVVADAFKYSKLVLATINYHDGIYPFMRIFLNLLITRNYQNRLVSIIENYSWKSNNGVVITEKLKNCKNLTFLHQAICIHSSVKAEDIEEINNLANKLS